MDRIIFERPQKKHERDAIELIQEFIDFGSPIEGVNGLHRFIDNYDAWLEKIAAERVQKTDDKNVPMETFFVYRENDHRLLGVCNLRLDLNRRFARFGGNAGSCIRPRERKKGYSKQVLYGMIKYFDQIGLSQIMLDCDAKNIPSKKSIQSLGGSLLKETYIDDLETTKEDYIIDVKEAINKYGHIYNDSIANNDVISYGNIITDIFYNDIVPMASLGNIDAFLYMRIVFGTRLDGYRLTRVNEDDFNENTVPELCINNKELFDELLIKYVDLAYEHYSRDKMNFHYFDEIVDENERKEYIIKYLIGNLFANASFYDYEHPIAFLKNRISMFEKSLEDEITINLDEIGAELTIREEPAEVQAETPYKIIGFLTFDDGYILSLPDVYAGYISEKNEYDLYTIMSKEDSNKDEEKPYLKKIREGYIAKLNGAPEHYFLASFLPLVLKDKLVIIPYLPQRWNAKRNYINSMRKISEEEREARKRYQASIQERITDGIIRYYSKLDDVSDGVVFTSLPYQADDKLHVTLDESFSSRCSVFNELFSKLRGKNETRNR